MIRLRVATPAEWLDAVLANFDAFLLDHAACERKASATGMLFVVRYPDRTAIIEPMIAFAIEELEHFQAVYRIVARRGLPLSSDAADPYAGELMAAVRHGRDERFLDRLLVAGILEARGCERFGLLAGAAPESELRGLYRGLTRADARHQRLFVDLAREYFDEETIRSRLDRLLGLEEAFVKDRPPRPALY